MAKTESRSDEKDRREIETGSFSAGRRAYLRLAGAAVGLTSLGTAAVGRSAAAEYRDFEFSETVDMVEDAGCDPTGEESCSARIEAAATEGALLEFPEGTYFLGEGVRIADLATVGIRGEGDATFLFPSGITDDTNKWFGIVNVEEFYYENVDWDITARNCAPTFNLVIERRFHIEDLEVIGRGDGPGEAMDPDVLDPDGEGLVRNFVAKDGSDLSVLGRVGVLVGPENKGRLRFENCHLEEFENNGLYAASSAGEIQVEGGVFRNNDRSQLRFCGEGSYVADALVEVDLSKMSPGAHPEKFKNGRGIWWESKKNLQTGGEIRDCEINIRQHAEQTTPNTGGGINVRDNGGACTIRDTTIDMDVTPRPAVYAKAPVGIPGEDIPPKPHNVVMKDVTITGEAKDLDTVRIEGRPDSAVTDCVIDQHFRYGVSLLGCDRSIVRDCVIDTGGDTPSVALWGSENTTVEDVESSSPSPVISDDDFD